MKTNDSIGLQGGLQRVAILVAWLVIWQIGSYAIGNSMLFCGPIDAVFALFDLVGTPNFWLSVAWSFCRIGGGFFAALVLGCSLGALAAEVRFVEAFLSPLINVVKSAPVVCLIALLLVLFGAHTTTSIVVGMVVFPPIYAAMIEGAASKSKILDEFALVFGIGRFRRVFSVEFPQYVPFLRAACKTAVAMSWKAGVAAELIGLPGNSIGEAVYLAKLTLDVADIIAWTAVVILVGWACEKLFLYLFAGVCALPGRCLANRVSQARVIAGVKRDTLSALDEGRDGASGGMLSACRGFSVELMYKSFGDQEIFDGLSLSVEQGERVCIMAPSGSGKTTFLRILMGFETVDAGAVCADGALSVVFQESCLIGEFTALQNLAVSARDERELFRAMEILKLLMPDVETLKAKRAMELSGGEKRRVEIARALAHESCVVLMDEPFSGLDDATKQVTAEVILDCLQGRTLVVATHHEGDLSLLDARLVNL